MDTNEDLPLDICNAAARNQIGKVLSWLMGKSFAAEKEKEAIVPSTLPFTMSANGSSSSNNNNNNHHHHTNSQSFEFCKSRINSKCREKLGRTLLHEAVSRNHTELVRLLLQLGAKVDSRNTSGMTPFILAVQESHTEESVRILLQWGATNAKRDMNSPSDLARFDANNAVLADLLATPLGGRRCQIQNLMNRKELNGTYGVAQAYLPEKDRYRILLEPSGERVNIRPKNLKRCDRSLGGDAEGFYLSYQHTKDGKGNITERWGTN